MFWYVLYGQVEEYRGQEADGRDSFIVQSEEREKVLLKVIDFHLCRRLQYTQLIDGRLVKVIV